MRAAPTALKNWLPTANEAWRADLITITLVSGAVIRWTTAENAILSGGNTYASGPIISRTYRQGRVPEIASLDLELVGQYLVGGVQISLLASQGYFDDARLQVDHVIGAFPGDTSLGVTTSWFEGRVAGTDPTPTGLKMSAADETETLSFMMLPRFIFQASCGHVVYDANCGLAKGPLTSSSTASGTRTTTTFGSGLTGAASGYYNGGVVTVTTGALAGVRRSVKTYTPAGGVFVLTLPLPSAPAAGDAFSVYPGCTRTLAACTAFGNVVAFRGFGHIPVSGS